MESVRGGDCRDWVKAGVEWRADTLEAAPAANPDLIYLCDQSGTILYANPPGVRQWGKERDELLGMNWEDLGLPPSTLEAMRKQRDTVFESGCSLVCEFPLAGPYADEVWESMLTPIQGKGGQVEVVVATLRNITQWRQIERVRLENEQNFRLLAENSTDMISRHDPDGTYLYVSPASKAITGYEPSELVGHSPYEFILQQDQQEIAAIHAAILHTSDTSTVAFRVRRKDGRTIWLESTIRTIRDPATKEVTEIHCSSRDASARKEAEEALRESQEQLQAILDNSTAIIYIKDADGKYLLVNKWYETLFERPADAIIGKTDAEIFSPEQASVFRANDLKVMQQTEAISFEENVSHWDELRTYVSIKFPLRNREGKVVAVGGISTDITDRKRVEEQLIRQNTLLQEAVNSERQAHDALKRAESQLVHAEKLSALGQLVAGVAHEINNPLAYVTSDVTVLKREVGSLRDLLNLFFQANDVLALHRPELHAEILERSDRIDLPFLLENLDRLLIRSNEGLRRIRQIIKDLRDFARLDEGAFKEVNLNDGIISTVNVCAGRAHAQGVELTTELDPLPNLACYASEINQVLLNLISNATDACKAGDKITVRSRAHLDRIEIEVSDTGKGIDKEVQGKIFDPFYTTKPIGTGTGLGLSISYGIIRSHGGTIEVDSEPGQGATFLIRLPLKPTGIEPPHSMVTG